MPSGIKLLVRADDLGSSHAANLACMKAVRKGIARSVEIMAPCAWFPEAITLLKDLPEDRDVGVHLTLTSEWPNVKWRPLTSCQSLVDSQGFFLPRIWPRYDDDLCLRNRGWNLDEVETEFRAQIEVCLANIAQITHLSYHMGCDNADPKINSLCKRLGDEYGLASDPFVAGYKSVPRKGKSKGNDVTTEILDALASLPPGKWILINHPSLDVQEMRGICNAEGRDVARERQLFTDACCSPAIQQLVRNRNIQLISYSAID
ncbi:ChbG/HpnK family deacetylase [Pelagicoccus enzymogenes]|uniref:ChbG/HpnK family deacetylase n=1 Tax=Pelagicoccus enzymogenes TaxID=2773457 RepID=UPI00280C97F6|nr:ChbG/HpnK family deacetylase [Pelagicoccus enzymogenes]MDQ8197131.1 ChbG/HpnK family deacetylase [Pelagicoccus enzymogenes]